LFAEGRATSARARAFLPESVQVETKAVAWNSAFEADLSTYRAMTPKDAIAAHVNWKLRIHALLSGKLGEKLEPSKIKKDDVCELGKWLHSQASNDMAAPQRDELLQVHAEFHREAARIVHEVNVGHAVGLEVIDPSSAFGKLTTRIVGILARS
jgi:hypothetical protein